MDFLEDLKRDTYDFKNRQDIFNKLNKIREILLRSCEENDSAVGNIQKWLRYRICYHHLGFYGRDCDTDPDVMGYYRYKLSRLFPKADIKEKDRKFILTLEKKKSGNLLEH